VFLKKEDSQLNEYSIAEFLEVLTDDDLEREMIKLISEGYANEELLEKLLEVLLGRKQK
jgi:hypothetical protein